MPIRCFLLEPTDYARASLRRYVADKVCPVHSYHDASTPLPDVPFARNPDGSWPAGDDRSDHSDPRWPLRCDCGSVFRDEDAWQLFLEPVYRRPDTGEEATLRHPPEGAMWYADWLNDTWPGPDGRCLMVMTPGGEWCVDGPCSNCTRKGEKHYCWCRHGVPPNVTVNKSGYPACSAGGGSIQAGSYHGFLQNGYLT